MENRKNTVLFVDDERSILRALEIGLRKEPYNKFYALSGQEALDLFDKEDIDVVVTDMRMPEMDGLQLLKEINKRDPKTVKIVLSGYTQLPQIIATINQVNIFKFITKPWDMKSEFKGIVREAISYYNTSKKNDAMVNSLEQKNALYKKLLTVGTQRMYLMEEDFQQVNQLMNAYFKYFLEYAQLPEGSSSLEAMSLMETGYSLLGKYLDILPTAERTFSYKEFTDDMGRIFGSMDNRSVEAYKNVFESNESYEHHYKGKFDNLKLLIEVIFEQYIDDGKRHLARIITSLEEDGIQLIIALPSRENPIDTQVKDVVNLVLTHLAKTIHGSLQYREANDKYIFIFNGVMKKSSQ